MAEQIKPAARQAPKPADVRTGEPGEQPGTTPAVAAASEQRGGTYSDVLPSGEGAYYRIYVDGVLHTEGWRDSLNAARSQAREDLQIARMFCGRAGQRAAEDR